MNNFECLKKLEQLQTGIMFDEVLDLNFATISLCKNERSSFWNRALIDSEIDKEQLIKIEEFMKGIDRVPALYFENRDNLKSLVAFLKENEYKFDFEDSWMFWGDQEIVGSDFHKVKKVTNEKELETYIKCFDACFQNDDPQNPYGELGDYLNVAKDAWLKCKDSEKLEYYIACEGDKPVDHKIILA